MSAPTAKRILIPLPERDFDPSEVAVTWRILVDRGHQVTFATPHGEPSAGDPLMLSGEGLDAWGFVPGLRKLKLLGLALRANAAARRAYAALRVAPAFIHPLRHADLAESRFDGLFLPGGHWARGMKSYLESAPLQQFVGDFFETGKPVAAICHGVLLAARARSPGTGKSALFGRKTTALTWKLENTAWTLMKYLGRFWDAGYYRTYLEAADEPAGYWSVQAEVTRALASPADFLDATPGDGHFARKGSGLFRDSLEDSRPAFVVADDNYLSARWPGDVHTLATRFADLLDAAGEASTIIANKDSARA